MGKPKPKKVTKKPEDRIVWVTKRQIAHFTGLTKGTIDKWDIRPKKKIGRENLYNLKDIWAYRVKGEIPEGSKRDAEETLLIQRRREKLDLEVEELAGQLVRAEEQKRENFRVGQVIREAMLNIPNRVSALVAASEDPEAVFQILNKEIFLALEGLPQAPS